MVYDEFWQWDMGSECNTRCLVVRCAAMHTLETGMCVFLLMVRAFIYWKGNLTGISDRQLSR